MGFNSGFKGLTKPVPLHYNSSAISHQLSTIDMQFDNIFRGHTKRKMFKTYTSETNSIYKISRHLSVYSLIQLPLILFVFKSTTQVLVTFTYRVEQTQQMHEIILWHTNWFFALKQSWKVI